MCDHCLHRFPLLSFSVTKFHQMLIPSNCRPRHESIPNFCLFTRLTPSYPSYSDSCFVKNGCIRSNFNRSPFILGSEDNEFSAELGFKENGENPFSLQKNRSEVDQTGGVDKSSGSNIKECVKPENLIPVEGTEGDDISKKAMGIGKLGFHRGRQVLRRSSFLAKQVISITSALSLGFVSQLWVDSTRSANEFSQQWIVMFVEVRSNLLSGESERFLLEDVSQVGDVVLVEDESVIENEFKMVGMDTLVGYKVVTPGRRNIGKVRGYTFNISSGAIESLELDSFGISIIPSSLVSTYALLAEDVLEVVSDTIVVHEAAALHIQRLTKGLLDGQSIGTSLDDLEEYSEHERLARSDQRSRRSFGRQKSGDNWDFPMDYLVCECPTVQGVKFFGDDYTHCEDVDEHNEKLACQCPEYKCKNTWGSHECRCSGGLLYMQEHDTCIGSAKTRHSWSLLWFIIFCLAAVRSCRICGLQVQ